jgi:hypothetical protein
MRGSSGSIRCSPASAGSWAAAGACARLAALRWPSERQAALAADNRLALDERLGTAVELARRLRHTARGQRGFDRLQIRDAIEQASLAPGGWLALDNVRRDS